MKVIYRRAYIIIFLLISIYNHDCLHAQMADSVFTLNRAVELMLSNYPSIRRADEEISISNVKKQMNKDIYMPQVAGTASYMWIDPISELSLNGSTIHIQSNHNINFGLSVNQLIWDFGKSRPKIEAAQLAYEIAQLEKYQLIKNLIIQTITSYYHTAYTRYSINVKERQMEDYLKMLSQIEIKKKAGTATNFDLLNTGSAYNSIKTEIIALNSIKEKQYVTLSLLTDTVVNNMTLLQFPSQEVREDIPLDSLIQKALINRPEMKIIDKQYKQALTEVEADKRLYNPTLSAGVSAGVKNGYEPDINEIRFNYSAGVTLNIPIFESNRSKQISMGKAQAGKVLAAVDMTKKEITSQVADSYLSLVSSFARIQQLKIQKEVSEMAFRQAETNYDAGTITNLELITASTNATNSELFLLQEQINYTIAYYSLLANIGTDIRHIIGE